MESLLSTVLPTTRINTGSRSKLRITSRLHERHTDDQVLIVCKVVRARGLSFEFAGQSENKYRPYVEIKTSISTGKSGLSSNRIPDPQWSEDVGYLSPVYAHATKDGLNVRVRCMPQHRLNLKYGPRPVVAAKCINVQEINVLEKGKALVDIPEQWISLAPQGDICVQICAVEFDHPLRSALTSAPVVLSGANDTAYDEISSTQSMPMTGISPSASHDSFMHTNQCFYKDKGEISLKKSRAFEDIPTTISKGMESQEGIDVKAKPIDMSILFSKDLSGLESSQKYALMHIWKRFKTLNLLHKFIPSLYEIARSVHPEIDIIYWDVAVSVLECMLERHESVLSIDDQIFEILYQLQKGISITGLNDSAICNETCQEWMRVCHCRNIATTKTKYKTLVRHNLAHLGRKTTQFQRTAQMSKVRVLRLDQWKYEFVIPAHISMLEVVKAFWTCMAMDSGSGDVERTLFTRDVRAPGDILANVIFNPQRKKHWDESGDSSKIELIYMHQGNSEIVVQAKIFIMTRVTWADRVNKFFGKDDFLDTNPFSLYCEMLMSTYEYELNSLCSMPSIANREMELRETSSWSRL
eukprot:CFRG4061T1